MKVLTIITSYNRQSSLLTLISKLEKQNTDLLILDDHSEFQLDRPDFVRMPFNYGKEYMWLKFKKLFNFAPRNYDYYVLIPDDVDISPNFIKDAVSSWLEIQDSNKICLSLLSDGRVKRRNWTAFDPISKGKFIQTQWQDFALICEKEFLDAKIVPISLQRWQILGKSLDMELGDYDEEYLTSASFTDSKTGIKGCFIDGSDKGVAFSGCHTRLTGNYFYNQDDYALEIGRISSLSIYGNDMTDLDILIADQSYIKIHSGNKIRNISVRDATVYKQSAGGWFTSLVDSITSEKISPIYGNGFEPDTVVQKSVAARKYNNANQSIANTGVVALIYNTELYRQNVGSTGNNLVIQEAGFYMIGAHCCFDTNNSGNKRVLRIKNNSTYIGIDDKAPLTGIQTILNVTTGYYCEEGDVITADVSQDSTGNLNVLNLRDWSNDLWVTKVF